MSGFERQLIEARDNVIRSQVEFEKAQQEAEIERQRLAKIASEQSTKNAIERCSRLVDPLVPMVDEVMNSVGNQIWGKGKYKKNFVSIGDIRGDYSYIVEKYPKSIPFQEPLAYWKIWQEEGEKFCYFSVGLFTLQDEILYFGVEERYAEKGMRITHSVNREQLEELMTEEFLLGPKVYFPPRFDYPFHG